MRLPKLLLLCPSLLRYQRDLLDGVGHAIELAGGDADEFKKRPKYQAAETGSQEITVDVDGWAGSQGLDNPELLHFRDYAAGFFWNSSYRKTMARLGQVRGADALARAYSDINLAYFVGRMDTVDCGADTLRRWRS